MFQELITAELKLWQPKLEFAEKTAGQPYECLFPEDFQLP